VHWSIQRADRTTHLRIVLIAVVAAAAVIIAAKSAQWDRTPGSQASGERSYTVSIDRPHRRAQAAHSTPHSPVQGRGLGRMAARRARNAI